MNFHRLDTRIARSLFLGDGNPIVRKMGTGDYEYEQLQCWLSQYVNFPLSIVTMLRTARARIAVEYGQEDPVVIEIDRNIFEETGGRTRGIAHADLLIEGCERELTFRPCSISPSTATSAFIATVMQAISGARSVSQVEGVVYTLEATATPELGKIILPLVQRMYLDRFGSGLSGSDLLHFLNMHTQDFEPGHHEGMRRALEARSTFIRSEPFFRKGVQLVLDAMQEWWQEIAEGR